MCLKLADSNIRDGQLDRIPAFLRIKYHDVAYLIKKRLDGLSRMDKDVSRSVDKWKVKLVAEGYLVLHEHAPVISDTTFVLAWISPWQRTVSDLMEIAVYKVAKICSMSSYWRNFKQKYH